MSRALVLALAALAGACVAIALACSSSTSAPAPANGAPDASASDATTDSGPAADGGDVQDIVTSPAPLTPAFSPGNYDYTVRCQAGKNAVAVTVTDALGPTITNVSLVEDEAYVVRGQYWIRCLPHDFPTITAVTHPDAGAPTPGYYLLNGFSYAIALDTRGTPVWYARGPAVITVDVVAHDVISFFPNGTLPYGYTDAGAAELHALDTSTVTSLAAVGVPTDFHELRALPSGDYLVLSYPLVKGVDLTGLGTFGVQDIVDCQVQELDQTGKLVWSWTASDHVDAVSESTEPGTNSVIGTPVVDVFHCNSVDVDSSGNLLVSMRHTDSVYYVDRSTGKVVWKLGGTASNKDGAAHITVVGDPEGTFNLQHDARILPSGDVSLYDDHGSPAATGVARAIEYALDHAAGTATVVRQYLAPTQALFEGSFRRFPDGHTVIGWGAIAGDQRVLTELDEHDAPVLDVSSTDGSSYRALKVPPAMLDVAVMRTAVGK